MLKTGNRSGTPVAGMTKQAKARKLWLSIPVMLLLSAYSGAAQGDKAPGAKKPPEPQNRPVLVNATRVSTDATARSAAKEEARQSAAETRTKDSNQSAVTEFKPAGPNDGSGEVVVLPKDSKKKKNIHGEVFGTTSAQGAGTQGGGGAVGATSKGGKTSVYVETEHQRTTPPR